MAARGEEFSDSGWGSADMALGGEDLIGRDKLVIARREQEHGNAYLGEIDAPAEGDECALGEPVLLEQPFDDLEIIGAGDIDRQLQHVPHRARIELVWTPQAQCALTEEAAATDLDEFLEHRHRHA